MKVPSSITTKIIWTEAAAAARHVVKAQGLRPHSEEDLRQDVLVELLERLWRYDPRRGRPGPVGTAGKIDAGTVHGTQKPVEIMRRPILNHTLWAEWVYDPFAGSGTTLIAAHTVGRSCLAIELSPTYCDVIIERFEALTGEKANKVES